MISFDNTEVAFSSKSNRDLKRAYWLFKIIASPFIVKVGKGATNMALKLRLPISAPIKATIFRQFCGGESIAECDRTISDLGKFGIGTILDYSVEGKTSDEDFDQTVDIIIQTIHRAANDPHIPFAVFKVTGIGRHDLIEKASTHGYTPTSEEKAEIDVIVSRINRICHAAHEAGTSVFIDAEESWIQDAIDQWTFDMMLKYNKERCIVFNTLQMYRHDRLAFLRDCLELAQKHQVKYGIKLVRGAYMEKERARAIEKGYLSPIQATKADTDKDYNIALKEILENRSVFSLCAGTHNEDSSELLMNLMQEAQIDPQSEQFYFAQLLGMSNHISYNVAHAKYHVAKYVPFGPVKEVLPYLLRRADENTSVAGQTGRELSLIIKELDRRKQR
ncbi:MAG: proline dehydrogenase family protein [Crocinitomicaceae bacterium]|jgi:proline dehydrogenase|nr:proline dehydrogenase family protein [Crocinitomicaceae bacterium]MDP4760212.1 proline dehydrogenase family protein [Crocinitomicaceae bacterium]